MEKTEHSIIVDAGWAYRRNDRGWTVYRDPDTGLWHTQAEALARVLRRRPELFPPKGKAKAG